MHLLHLVHWIVIEVGHVGRLFLAAVFKYILTAGKTDDPALLVQIAVQSLSEETGETVMTIAEQLQQKGEKRGERREERRGEAGEGDGFENAGE